MAITGTKAFTSGEVLTANDVNQYLMRGVKVFSSTAVRDAAYGGAGEPVLEEGETAFITGTDTLQVYGGTALGWLDYRRATAGQVLQVVQTVKSDTFTTTSTSFTDVTGLTATITPSSTSSKVLIMAQFTVSMTYNATNRFSFRINGGNSSNYVGDAAGSRIRSAVGFQIKDIWRLEDQNLPISITYLDSPATTSATTYAVQIQVGAGTGAVNRSTTDTDANNYNRTASSITVMEISA